MDASTFQIKDVVVSARGAESAAILNSKGEKIIFSLTNDAIYSPFGASSFGDEQQTRRTIEFSLSPEHAEFWEESDKAMIELIAKNSERLFK